MATVWRLDVTGGVDHHQEILIDDRTGVVLLAAANQTINRIVCDNNEALKDPNAADLAVHQPVPAPRVEGGAPPVRPTSTGLHVAGAVSDAVHRHRRRPDRDHRPRHRRGRQGGRLDRPAVLHRRGQLPYDERVLERHRDVLRHRPRRRDDVTGHELTHGVTDRNSAPLLGPVRRDQRVDLRHHGRDRRPPDPDAGDSPTNWQHRRGPAVYPEAIRNLQDPTVFGDPDRTRSPQCVAGPGGNHDNGGVHSNSGVGNKTAYLIMKGGTFNGQTITGIDAGDTYTKTAKLYLLVDQSLASGADYADLAAVLDQSCNALVGHRPGFTAADCANVHKATLATQLRSPRPTRPSRRTRGRLPGRRCRKTVLFDSETGAADAKFTSAAPQWTCGEDPYWGSNAHSGRGPWSNAQDPASSVMAPASESMVTASPRVPSAARRTCGSTTGTSSTTRSTLTASRSLRRRHGRGRRHRRRGRSGRRRRACRG